jgi:Ca-activated chloride channel homolog
VRFPSIDFAHYERLVYLLLLLPFALRIWRGRRRRLADWLALGQGGRLPRYAGWSWLAAVACLFIALAQPRWGRTAEPSPPGHDVVLVVDTSRSMAAEDATPNRLGRAVEEAENLVVALGRERGDRVAIVAFSGRGELRCPLTEHLGAARETLRELQPGDIEPGGTDLGAALTSALSAFDEESHTEGRTIVVFSDGEAHDDSWRDVMKRLETLKVIVHGVAIGDAAQGHEIPLDRNGKALKYHGETVLSRRTDAPLEEISRATGGLFLPLGLSRGDLGELYRTRIAPAERRKRQELPPTDRAERFPLFIAAALMFGLFGSWSSPRTRGLLGVFLLASLGAAPADQAAKDAVSHGRAAFDAAEYRAALVAFEEAIVLQPDSAIARYNAAATLYKLKRFDEAAERYQEARARASVGLRMKIDYALGNTALAQGSVVTAIHHYDDCIASKAAGASYDRVRGDALQNRIFAEQHRPRRPEDSGSDPGQGQPKPTPRSDRGPNDGDPKSGSDEDSPNPLGGPDAGKNAANRSRRPNGDQPRDGNSPEERLASALETVRDAERNRLPDRPSKPLDGDRKDW